MGSSDHSSVGSSGSTAQGASHGTGSGRSTGESWGESTFESEGESRHFTWGQNESTGHARSRSESKGTTDSSSTTLGTSESSTTGEATAEGNSQQSSQSLTEVLHILSCDEQLFPLAQEALRRPRRQAHVLYEGAGTVLALARAIEYPADLCGVPVLEQFLHAQAAYFESLAVPRAVFDPRAVLLSIPRAPTPPATAATTPPTAPVIDQLRGRLNAHVYNHRWGDVDAELVDWQHLFAVVGNGQRYVHGHLRSRQQYRHRYGDAACDRPEQLRHRYGLHQGQLAQVKGHSVSFSRDGYADTHPDRTLWNSHPYVLGTRQLANGASANAG